MTMNIADLTADSINYEVKSGVNPTVTALTDGYNEYNKLKEIIAGHKSDRRYGCSRT